MSAPDENGGKGRWFANSSVSCSEDIAQQYARIRQQTLRLCRNLDPEDMVPQSMPDASPTKWHLAHTTWFFETFILQAHIPNYTPFDTRFQHLFNSYYVSAGSRYERPMRGLLTRPRLDAIMQYRERIDEHMLRLLDGQDPAVSSLATVGLHHEMQHQELILTDILHLLAQNPLKPKIFERKVPKSESLACQMLRQSEVIVEVGAEPEGFSYDCERPKHKTYLSAHALANRLVTNGEWMQFMADGGYDEPLLWLSDGWNCKEQKGWQAPLYWQKLDEQWHQFGLDGLHEVDLHAPVCHVSYYEADAFARWAGKRLPKEHELEVAACNTEEQGNFIEDEYFRPVTQLHGEDKLKQLYGDVWEWTQSAYLPYPKFKAEQGALGEYNGKFMVNQFVLKGGSCATAKHQIRASYRNFFYPHHRWQFSGLRLAEDI